MGHTGTVTGRAPIVGSDVSLKDLVVTGLLLPGAVLRARGGNWATVECMVLVNDYLQVDGKTYTRLLILDEHQQLPGRSGEEH